MAGVAPPLPSGSVYTSVTSIICTVLYYLLRPSADDTEEAVARFAVWWKRGKWTLFIIFLATSFAVVCTLSLVGALVGSQVRGGRARFPTPTPVPTPPPEVSCVLVCVSACVRACVPWGRGRRGWGGGGAAWQSVPPAPTFSCSHPCEGERTVCHR
jgi:hypothetical protein